MKTSTIFVILAATLILCGVFQDSNKQSNTGIGEGSQ
jgi:hypothetical protein